MKKYFGAALLALLVLTGAQAQAAYDSAKVKAAMQTFFGALGTIKKGVDATDTQASVAAFQTVVDAATPLLAMNPPKGTKADWDKAFNGMVTIAKKGISSSEAKDWDAAKAALADLRKAMNAGHGTFR